MTQDPFQPPSEPVTKNPIQSESISSDLAAYNVVSDTLGGVNVRWSDNRFQAVFISVSIAVVAAIGAILAALNTSWNLPWYGGGLIGSFAGLVIGTIASGTYLMIYRAIKHLKGEHD